MTVTGDIPGGAAPTVRARSPLLVVVALVAAQLAAADGITGVYVMLPAMFREFPGDATAISWVVTAFFLTAATVAALAGRFADLLGRRTVAVTLLGFGFLGGIGGAFATSVGQLIAVSVLLGIGTVLAPILIGNARETLPPERIGLGVGAIAAAGSAGAGLIFLLTGLVVDHYGRTGGYLLTSATTAVSAMLLLVGVPHAPRPGVRLSDIDVLPGILFGPAVGGAILAIELGAARGWRDGVAPGLLAASVLLALYWWRDQLRRARPLIDLRVLSYGYAPQALLAVTLLGATTQQGQAFSLVLQQPVGAGVGFGLSAGLAGLVMIPINGTAALVSPVAGQLSRSLGPHRLAWLGAAVLAAGWIACAYGFADMAVLIGAAIATIAGLALLFPTLYLLIIAAVPRDLTSGAAGLGATLFNLGFAVGSQVYLRTVAGPAGGIASAAAYRTGFVWLAGASLLILAALLPGVRRPTREIGHG